MRDADGVRCTARCRPCCVICWEVRSSGEMLAAGYDDGVGMHDVVPVSLFVGT